MKLSRQRVLTKEENQMKNNNQLVEEMEEDDFRDVEEQQPGYHEEKNI